MLNQCFRGFALLCLLLFCLPGCSERREAKQPADPTPEPVVAFKKPVEREPVKAPELTEAQKRALEEKKAAALRKAQELEKIKAARDAEEKVKKQLDDSRKAILNSPERTGHLRNYRAELDKVKEYMQTAKDLKTRITDIANAGNPPNMESTRIDLEDQLAEIDRQIPEAARKARMFAAQARFGIPQNLQLSDQELTKLAFSLR